MGNDGGSIPTRRELVKEGAKDLTTTQVKEIQNEQQEHFWATCALSHEPLRSPVVSDGIGTLYNKAAVLDHLLALSEANVDKESLVIQGTAFKDRIRSLKDVIEVKFETESETLTGPTKWVCPITGRSLGPGTKAIYLVPCGHAFAESVVKEMSGENCLQCTESYSRDDIIPILSTSQTEKDRLEQRLQRLKLDGRTHSLKKAYGGGKKRKKVVDVQTAVKDEKTLESLEAKTKSESLKNGDTASLTAKVLAEQEDRNKKRKFVSNDNVKSLFSSKSNVSGKNVDFMTRGFSIPANGK